MREESTQLQPASRQTGPLKFTSFNEIFRDMQQTFDSIARRAYEIFEGNGRQFGRDLEDWFHAEGELLHPVNLELRESDNNVIVRAEVPGFEVKDLEVGIDGRQLTIAGKHETSKEEEKEKVLYSERRSNQLYRCLELPAEVDSEKTTATLKGGILELTMPKTAPAKRIRIEPKAA
ncbi:MAG TPA: Hsp20/alpha crystallin family protein [Candidatus Dormibacteraeota bacterium]|nr:Hsp20/alpha crystallin family protein [Candidatus Dormibacteraeota bacterium]